MRRGQIFGGVVFLINLCTAAHAQWDYTTNGAAITITRYTGPGGAVSIPSTLGGLPVTSLGNDGVFIGNAGLNSVTIPVGVVYIGSNAFAFCTNLSSASIPAGVTNIASSAFEGCWSLTSISIPASVTLIGDRAFDTCYQLSAISVDPFNPAFSSVGGVLFNKTLSTLIQCPGGITGNYVITNTVTNLSATAFSSCTNLTSITVPASVTNIGVGAFGSCLSLTGILVAAANPAYTNVAGVLFSKDKLTLLQYPAGISGSYSIPSTTDIIGDGAFQDCQNLTGITIPSGVIIIGNDAFLGCSHTNFTTFTIPNTVKIIGDDAFSYCGGLSIITLNNSVTNMGDRVFKECSNLGTINSFPNTLTRLGDELFYDCGALVKLTLPNTIKSVGESAFAYCSIISTLGNWTGALTNIGTEAFLECNSLSGTFTFPNTVSNIAESTFYDCYALTGVTLPTGLKNIEDDAFFSCGALTGSLTFPSTLTNIGAQAFYSTALTSVTIPNNVASIGSSAFSFCGGLGTITVNAANPYYSSVAGVLFDKTTNTLIQCPGAKAGSYTVPSSVTNIAESAFEGCANFLTSVTVPSSVISIGSYAFTWCSSMTNISLPTSITSISDGMFASCGSLPSITIPNGVTNIGYAAFSDCFALTNVTIPASVTSIGDYAFSGSELSIMQLASITIPDSVTYIGDGAFQGCVNLGAGLATSLILPSSITHIGDQAFSGCSNLAGVFITGNAPSVGPYTFEDLNLATIYYLPNTTGWGTTFGGRPAVLWNPQAQNLQGQTNQFTFTITGSTNLVIVVEATTNLVNPVWSPLSTNTLVGGSSVFTDSQSSSFSRRFYRFRPPLNLPGPAILQQPTSVAACSNGLAMFSVLGSQGALFYQWQTNSVDISDGGKYSGTTLSNLTISGADQTVTGSYRCILTYYSKIVTSAVATLTLNSTTNPPAAAGSITGPSTVCSNATGVAYSISSVSGATGYAWTVPNGGTVSSGQGTTSITVNWGTASSGNVTVTPTNSCFSGTANSKAVTVTGPPTAAGAISGLNTVCSNATGVAYSIGSVSGATGYSWTAPAGASVASGQGTTAITVNWGTANSGNVTVTPTNNCFSGTASSLPVTVIGKPAAAGAISGLNTVCSNTAGVAYSIAAVSNATGYAWSVPAGASVASGQGTTSITVNWGTASSGNVTLTPTNSCYSGTGSSLLVTVIGKPAVPGAITGPNSVCSNTAGVAYSITSVSNATGYAWSVPAGASVASGQGTTSITVNWGTASSGNVTFTPTNNCFSGDASSLFVTVIGKPNPAGAISGAATVCSNTAGVAYSIAAVSGATGYNWTVPSGATIASGQSTTSITVNWGTASSGNVTVTPTNSCFSGTLSSLAVTVIGKPADAGSISGLNTVCSNVSGVVYSIAPVSGTTGYNWSVPSGATVASGQSTTSITVNWGTASSGNVTVTPTNSCFSGTASSLAVTVIGKPATAGPVSGPSSVCSNATGVAYAIAPVSGATGYSWTVPVGASVASGQGTTSIAVNWGTATFGNVTVTPTNSCFSNTASSLFVTVIQKPVAGPITGSSAVCSNASGVAYSIATVSWATGYNWTLPVGATVASGQNTTNITVNWGTASSGNVTVTPTNSCFSGTASSLPVTVNVPPIVTSPPTNLTVCAGSLASFSATGSGSPAPGVQWQRSTDSGTNWIDLAGATNLTHGFSTILGDDNSQYRVALSNECGTAASGTATLTVLPGQLSVSPAQWNFGAVATGVTAQATFIVTNTGCGQLSGTATSTAPFAVVAGNAYALAGFGATNVTVSFTPLMEGWFTNAVIFTSDGGSATNTVIGQGAIVPVALFSASPTNGVEPLVVAFTDQSTGTITNRFWDFGDGNNTNITSTSVTNTYAAGNYTVTLIVSGPLGIISTNTQAIGVLTPFAQWQMDYFGCTVCPEALASADPDGDGMSNTNEFLAGFNPTNNAARLRIINLTPSSVNMVITYLGADGDANGSPGPKTNVVEYTLGLAGVYSNNFQSLGWTNILTGGNGTGTVVIATDTNGATSNPARYYRIRVLTP